MDTERMSISDRLKDIRLYYGYKQTEIANKLGICRNAYCEYEHYKRVIPIKRLNTLANFYNLNIDYLIGLSNIRSEINATDIDINIVSSRISQVRTDNKLNVSEFAKILNISTALVSYYESGKRLISTSVCYDISKKFNISVDYLLGKSNEKYVKK